MDPSLFKYATRFKDTLQRNVVDVPKQETIYKHLVDDKDFLKVSQKAQQRAKRLMASDDHDDDFVYTAAIEYPFKSEPYMSSRYSDGTFPVWYGSKAIITTIYETAYHTKQHLLSIEDIELEKVIIKKRAIYTVCCNSILLDVTKNQPYFSSLTSSDYSFCNTLGCHAKSHGLSGILSPSARHASGINANIFKKDVLSTPEKIKEMIYEFHTADKKINVIENNEIILSI